EILLSTPSETYARIDRLALEYHDWITDHHHDELVRRLTAEGFTVTTRDHLASKTGYVFARRTA
ncbi:MAG: hypothetical protein SF182_23410, partial [Deltaproteobacteria bacterium]|nr:hypothetical protein [Deltaproteobacteria bacterium]